MYKKIGFIGLGNMGMPMALNLCKHGFPLYVCSRNNKSQQSIISAGGGSIESFQKMGHECDIIISIVPADNEINAVYMGKDGILSDPKEGLVCIDMTSARGSTKQEIVSYINHMGMRVHFIDAPVSGGVRGAEEGTLSIMVGCSTQLFSEHLTLFKALGTNIIHTGDVGSASNIKMLNQMLNAANTAIAAEVLCLSRTLGVDDKILSEVINQSSGGSYIFEHNVPKHMMQGTHNPGFKLNLMKKDCYLFSETAKDMKSFIPLASLVLQLYEASSNADLGEKHYTAIHSWYEKNQKSLLPNK